MPRSAKASGDLPLPAMEGELVPLEKEANSAASAAPMAVPFSSSQQMILDLFATAVGESKAIHELEKDLGFNKSSRLIDITDLSRLGRQFLNAAFFLTEPEFEEQDKDLKLFMWAMNYPSRNMVHLKKISREAQKSSIQVQIYDEVSSDKDIWISVPMVGKIIIANGRIIYHIPKDIRKQLADPNHHSYLSMRIAAAFKNQYTLEIYEKLLQYLGAGYTPWKTVDETAKWFGVGGLKYAKDWRYMRRDLLAPVRDEINEISNISIEIETRSARGTRKIEVVRFKVTHNPTGKYSPANQANKIMGSSVLDILQKEFGLSDIEIKEIFDNEQTYTPERIMSAVELTRHRCKEREIAFPGLYLMRALRENFKLPSILKDKKKNAEKVEKRQDGLLEASAKSVTDSIDFSVMEWFSTLGENAQAELWGAFCRSLPGKSVLKMARLSDDHPAAKNHPTVVSAFASYIEKKRSAGDL